MEDLIRNTLSELGYPVKQQGSLLPEEEYPDHFFTYWNDATDGSGFYNNNETATEWQYSLNFYSIDHDLVNDIFKVIEDKKTAKSLLISAGFVVSGTGYDVASDENTHTGRGITILYRQQQ